MVEHAAGGSTPPTIDPTEIVNEAGRYLVAMHSWSFLNRPVADLNFVANQAYVSLPTDFGRLVHVDAASTLDNHVTVTTLDVVQYLRASPVDDPFNYHVALEYATQSSATAAQAVPRLAIYPTPGSNATAALKLVYQAGWTELSANTSVANIPIEFDPLLVQLVRAIAMGYLNESDGERSVVARIDAIEGSEMVRRLKSNDGMKQPSLGPMTGGIAQGSSRVVYRPHSFIYAGGDTP